MRGRRSDIQWGRRSVDAFAGSAGDALGVVTCSRPHAPDGSPVEFYALLPPMGEPEIIHAAVPAGAEILELGCGAGRLTHPLLELGHPVVAVDQSAEMLAHIRGAEKIHADIETLDIGRALPVVLLSSQLVNTSDAQQRSAFLRTCRRHVQQDGVVVIQRHDPDLANLPPKEEVYERLGFRFSFLSPKLEGHSLSAVMHYRFEDREWLHPFTTRILDDDEIEAELVAAELRVDGWLDPKRTWLTARPL